MSVTTPTVGTNSSGQTEQGTQGTSITNSSASTISSSEFLDLMMDSLQDQDPLNPSSSDPTQYLTELAQMTSVEQETNTAQNTSDTAQAQSVSQAIGLIGDSVTYLDQTSGDKITGTVSSVQITSSGPTLTVDGTAGVALSSILNVQGAGSSATSGSTTSGAATSGTTTNTSATDNSTSGSSSSNSGTSTGSGS
jgi:flagellar basal-body rod modification protein FlgD